MNPIIQSLHDRKSVRAYTDEPITAEEKQLILEAAVQAPTAGNQQLYTILDITDPEIKDRLNILCDNQPFIVAASLVLVFLADPKKWYDAYAYAGCEPRPLGLGDLLLSVSDANIAAQNAVVAAQSLGIGSCYIGDVMEHHDGMCELLHLPRYLFPAAMVVFGRPTQQQIDRPKPPRCPMEYIVHENTYRTLDRDELHAMLEQKSVPVGYQAWIEAFCKRKYNADFSREMTRSVTRYCLDYLTE